MSCVVPTLLGSLGDNDRLILGTETATSQDRDVVRLLSTVGGIGRVSVALESRVVVQENQVLIVVLDRDVVLVVA